MEEILEKKCNHCKKNKDIKTFLNEKTGRIFKRCENCRKENTIHYQNNKDYYLNSFKKYYTKNKENKVEHYNKYRKSVNGRYNKYKQEAKERNLSFELSLEQFEDIVSKKCIYCDNFSKNKDHCGIDRIQNHIGYTIENSVPCCFKCNLFKSNKSVEEWLKEAKRLTFVLPKIIREKLGYFTDGYECLTFDDVSLVPNFSTIKSRKDPEIKATIGNVNLNIPIVASPMNTIVENRMMIAMSCLGGSSVLHRYMNLEDQLNEILLAKKNGANNFFIAVGATGDFLERIKTILENTGENKFCIDVANGFSLSNIDAIKEIRKIYEDKVELMTGNVCSYEGAKVLAEIGSNSIRVGIGPGSMCKTRVVSGHGIPQLTAIEDCVRIKNKFPNVGIVADGGIKTSGDIVKALAAGADAVMLGSLLAGTDETPGSTIKESNLEYKLYAGMASEAGRGLNNWFDRTKTSYVPEGESVRVMCKGPVQNIVQELVGGLRVGMSYAGAHNLQELREKATFVRITNAGYTEGTPHGKK